jgi:hypothetical protein
MAARKRKLVLTDTWKERIRAGVIMDRLLKHVNGDLEMSPTQVNAAKILLGKIVPDLSSSKVEGDLTLAVGSAIVERLTRAERR